MFTFRANIYTNAMELIKGINITKEVIDRISQQSYEWNVIIGRLCELGEEKGIDGDKIVDIFNDAPIEYLCQNYLTCDESSIELDYDEMMEYREDLGDLVFIVDCDFDDEKFMEDYDL